MKIAYIENECIQQSKLIQLLSVCLENENVNYETIDAFSSSDDFFRMWHPRRYNLIILDIYIGNDSGMDIAKKIRQTDKITPIVFCSVSNDFACESYEVGAMYYIQKPITYHKIYQLVHRIKYYLNIKSNYIIFPGNKRIPIEEVMFTEYYNHVVSFFLERGEVLTVRTSQKNTLAHLQKYKNFVSITPGIIINLNFVIAYDKGVFKMSSGKELHVSRRQRKNVSKYYYEYMFDELRRNIF